MKSNTNSICKYFTDVILNTFVKSETINTIQKIQRFPAPILRKNGLLSIKLKFNMM